MYLAQLTENQKRLFLGLAYHIASADGNYSDDENLMIKSYCAEMNIEFDLNNLSAQPDEIIARIKAECEEKSRKIIIFELIGLALVDHNYDDAERTIINTAMDRLDINKSFGVQCEKLLNEYIEFQNKINALVLG